MSRKALDHIQTFAKLPAMPTLVQRAIAYVFIGSFCAVGPLLLIVAFGTAIRQVLFIHSAQHANGTVIELREYGSTRSTTHVVTPVFRFTADGQTYVVAAKNAVREDGINVGEPVDVLYARDHPETALIDNSAQLWMFPLVVGAVGAGFSTIPAFVLLTLWRRRRASARITPPFET